MELSEESLDEVRVLSVLQPRLDLRSAGDLKNAVADLMARQHRRIVLDLGQVAFVDSSGLGAIVGALKLVGREGELVVCGLNESVSTLFKLTRMDKVFRCFATRAEAAEALSREGR